MPVCAPSKICESRGIWPGARPLVAAAQALKTDFSTPDDIRPWVATTDESAPLSIQVMNDLTGSFVRIAPGTRAMLAMPSPVAIESSLQTLPTLIDPGISNAVRVRLRHTTALQEFGGFWLHGTTPFDGETYGRVPFFDSQPLPGDGLWHDLTFKFSD